MRAWLSIDLALRHIQGLDVGVTIPRYSRPAANGQDPFTDGQGLPEDFRETFAQAWRGLDQFRGDSRFIAWLYRNALNEAHERNRRKTLDTRELAECEEIVVAQSGTGRHPDAAVESRELSDFLAEQLRRMPLEDRAPIILRDIASCSYQEVADALDLPLDATKSRIHRARMRLRDQVEARYGRQQPGSPGGAEVPPDPR